MMKTISRKLTVGTKFLFVAVCQLAALHSFSQYYEQKPEPEIAIGMRVISGNIIYGPKSFYTTTSGGVSIQPLVRYEAPVKINSRSPYQHRYISFVVEGGFLFCKAKVFDSVFIDRTNNTITRDHSYNSTYLPVYMGFYNRSKLCIGAEIFYWKGLGARDIWGAKFLSLGYNGVRFRITASGEWYAQTKNIKHSGTIFSVDFSWKLLVDD